MGATATFEPVRQLHVLPLQTLSDERLAQLAGAGHTDAFQMLYERYRVALGRYCRSIVRDPEDAGDALQNTMLAVLRAIRVRGPSGPVRPWLYRIAHNESISILRRRRPHEQLSVETPDRADTERASFTRDRLDALLVDLRSLPERQRGALVMRELGGLEYSEIAEALDMSPAAACKHVFEARVALHDIDAGRNADCNDIVRRISDGDGRVLRARSVRGHLRGCASCSAFERGLRARRGTLALIPPLPLVSTGAMIAAALHGATATTATTATTSGLAAGGSIAAGSLLGGGPFAAIKGLIAAGAIAVAGAGVIVGTGISLRASHPQHSARVVTHAARARHGRAPATIVAPPPVTKPVRLAVARPAPAPATNATRAANLVTTTSTARNVSAVAAPPRPQAPPISKPSNPAPTTVVPVAVTTPTPAPTAPPSTTTAAPAPGTSPTSATTQWIDAIIASALRTAGGDIAAAEAQVQQQLTQSGVSPTTVTSTIQGLIASILSGGHS